MTTALHATVMRRVPTHAAGRAALPMSAHCRERLSGRLSLVTEPTRAEVFDQLRRVIAWEMHAQAGMQRAVEEMPPLIADTMLDYFDITLKPGADLSNLE
jgi:hypothetical protein